MSNFVQVNVISHSKNSLGSCYEHNVERKKDGEDLPHLLDESNCLGNETITFAYSIVSSGTYEENLKNYYSKQSKSNNYKDLKDSFDFLENLRLEQLQNENRKDYQTKHLIEFEVGLSEEKAKEYISSGIDINEGFKQYMNDLKAKFGMNTLQISIHKDEGYIDKDNILHHNIHAHFIVHNYNFEQKKAILSNFRKKDYRQLQTLAQKSFNSVGLDFRRGLSKFQTKLKHQKRNDFILNKQNQELKILQKDLLQKNQEIKDLYTLLNSQKNQLKELRLQFEKDSNIYKMLSLNIKNLTSEEQSKREEFRQLDSKIKELKNQVQKEEEIIQDDLEYANEIKSYFKTYLKENTSKSKDNKYYINNINDFYKSLIDNFYNVSNLDLKLEKLEKLKNENSILKSHLEKSKLDNQSLNEHLKKLDLLNLKIKDLIDKKDILEEENYTLKSYLKDKNLEKDYQIYTRNLNLQNTYEIER
ncbi:hypothetical protein [Arcobacter defluvii]|uniref:Mobilization protein n=1 Tax=Arcobacter defluvii TaxID=873191 RepID=A0AAE7E736_9BACT|nr:hypothetical protein [Arcobacter defluvii]QKF77631.1 hypothetical protein ADFLV_1610 [Arcobacter defluvii]RXI34394.1 hypothetical protein CP964_03295 [Arcobacter defluvii]